MKKIALIIVCLTTLVCQAQEHLKFMEIPIEGTLNSFVDKLIKEKGFREARLVKGEEYDNFETRKLIGNFENFKGCRVMVHRLKEFNHVSSVTVNCDTTDYNLQQARILINRYDSIYGEHKHNTMMYVSIYRWELESGNIQINISSLFLTVTFMDYTERIAKNIKPLEEMEPMKSIEEIVEESIERETVREICGISFGSSYENAKTKLENKYGYPEYSPDKMIIHYKYKNYAGIVFDDILFLFQSDGYNSYFNGCVFILEAKTLDEAKKKRERLYEKLSSKYTIISDKDDNGLKFYAGGYSPIRGDGLGFTIEIIKYNNNYGKSRVPYAARLMYGRYNYIKEEF